jgi:nucleoside 2-deoxyribosyltransferase
MDRTAAERVRRYRRRQRAQLEIARVEVQVPSAMSVDIKALGHKARAAFQNARHALDRVDFVLGTINAPRPRAIDLGTFLHCLFASAPQRPWQPHIEALFDEVSEEAVHDLVLAKIVSFEDLYRASRTWNVGHGRIAGWIREMADFRLASAAA